MHRIRVVSYNLLANAYASTDYSKKVLFKYCPAEALDFEYRKHLLLKELLGESTMFTNYVDYSSNVVFIKLSLFCPFAGYNGDIICLQEVDRGMFKYELDPCFSLNDIDGDYAEKEAQTSEGAFRFISDN